MQLGATTFDTRSGAKSAAPGDRILCDGAYATVRRVVGHPPGDHPPIRPEWHAVEIVTDRGSRWAGSESAPRIMGDLRMHWGES